MGERVDIEPRRRPFWWVSKKARIVSDPTGGDDLGSVEERLTERGVSARRTKNGGRVCLMVDQRYVPEKDALFGWSDRVEGWVQEPPIQRKPSKKRK